MIYTPEGRIYMTTTKDLPGLYSASGVYQVTDVTSETDFVGIYASDGSWNVTILEDESVRVSLYADNGSFNVVEGASGGRYSPCGAWNVEFV